MFQRNIIGIGFIVLLLTSCGGKTITLTPVDVNETPAGIPSATLPQTARPIPTETAAPTEKPKPITPSKRSGIEPGEPTPIPLSSSVGPFQAVLLEKPLPDDLVSILHAAEDGSLWLQTENEILILRDDTWEVALTKVPGEEVIGVDQAGLIWVIKSDGQSISSWDGSAWTDYSEEEGWIPLGEYAQALGRPVNDGQGQVWIVTTEDLRVFDGDRWQRYTPQEIGLSHPLEAEEGLLPEMKLAFLKTNQELWLAACNWIGSGPIGGNGVMIYGGQSWRTIGALFSSGCTKAIQEDSAGNIWFGLDGSLWRYDPDSGSLDGYKTPPSPFEDGSFYREIDEITIDPEGNPWVGFLLCGGGGCGATLLYHHENSKWVEIAGYDFPTYKFTVDPTGDSWLFTMDGIYTIKDNIPVLFAGIGVEPFSVTQGPTGDVWFIVRDPIKGNYQLWTLPAS